MNIKLRRIQVGRGSVACFVLLLLSALCAPCAVHAQEGRTEYRAFWVDTFNTALNNHNDVLTVINNARAAKANALFVQVRRRGDSWYLNSLEPRADRTSIQPGFDPLQDIINEAHAAGIEVHAFVIMSAIWGRAPNVFPPENANHAFNLHGGFNAATNTITPGANNWLTRTLLPDGSAGITYQGHRFGSDFWIDFGHPDAAAYTVEVLNHLVRNYDIDGLHLDRIRYPEIGITGQTPSTGANVGYNSTSVERFQRHYDIAVGSPAPAPGNPQWSQWRRDQVTNIVRRVYLNALSIKPRLKVSAAVIAFGGIGATEAAWNSAEANWRVYQDWRAWTEEGIIDIAIPMVYKAEHTATVRPQYDQWDAWLRGHLYNRAGMMGQGAANNAIEGTLRQTRRTLTPASGANNLSGIIYFSMATSNIAVANNPFAVPSPTSTGARSFAEFASGLTTGKSANGATRYEPAGLTPIFGEAAQTPSFPWKDAPTLGHFKGEARAADNTPLDTATVTIENLDTHATRTATTDGGGFFGAVDLAPGAYRASTGASYYCFNVAPGLVADAVADTVAPHTDAALAPAAPDGQNGWYTNAVAVSFAATDNCAGVAATEYSTDGGQTWQAYTAAFNIGVEGTTTVLYRSIDRAGNTEATGELLVKIDGSAPLVNIAATPSIIRPANNGAVNVSIKGSASDAVSGLASVSYVVTDEYGTPLSIPARSLSGQASEWTDSLTLEARRDGRDRDGRLYRVVATVTDEAGNTATATANIVVPHDQREH
ncbi:MAG TPA: family 10 glycosylhydrolase [Pyrinomonadaceae bacterium]|nr:family 10 glycosylhydrolase [Pyrinomonadaceae bacterium]